MSTINHDDNFIGPLPYGAVVDNGSLYPEVYTECTRYECDWLKLTVVEANLIFKALKTFAATWNKDAEKAGELNAKLRTIHEELIGEGSFDFWEAQD